MKNTAIVSNPGSAPASAFTASVITLLMVEGRGCRKARAWITHDPNAQLTGAGTVRVNINQIQYEYPKSPHKWGRRMSPIAAPGLRIAKAGSLDRGSWNLLNQLASLGGELSKPIKSPDRRIALGSVYRWQGHTASYLAIIRTIPR